MESNVVGYIVSFLLFVISILVGCLLYYQRQNNSAIREKLKQCDEKDEKLQELILQTKSDMTKESLSNANTIDRVSTLQEMFIERNDKDHESFRDHIKNLYEHKDKHGKAILILKTKAGIEEKSKLELFREQYTNVSCLLVEDDKLIAEGMADFANQYLGFNVDITYTVDQAIEAVENKNYDCAIVDYFIGEETIDRFIKECKDRNKLIKNDKEFKMVIVSGQDGFNVPFATKSLPKPVDWEKMSDKMVDILS